MCLWCKSWRNYVLHVDEAINSFTMTHSSVGMLRLAPGGLNLLFQLDRRLRGRHIGSSICSLSETGLVAGGDNFFLGCIHLQVLLQQLCYSQYYLLVVQLCSVDFRSNLLKGKPLLACKRRLRWDNLFLQFACTSSYLGGLECLSPSLLRVQCCFKSLLQM